MKKIICFSILVFTFILFLSSSSFANTLTYSEVNFNKYPGYKSLVDNLTKAYSNWNFLFYDTGLNWDDVIAGQYEGHGPTSPLNLSPAKNSNYSGDWICEICGTKTYDSGNWYCASKSAIAYMMDPRGSLNATDIFQFQSLSSTAHTRKALETRVKGTWLDSSDCVDAIIQGSKDNNISPYFLISKLFQEQGEKSTGTVLTQGKGYEINGKIEYKGYYNAWNIGATGNTTPTILENGLKRAKAEGWDTLAKSIIGGAKFLSSNYIARGQNTTYFQKFNVVAVPYHKNQYMQNVLGAYSEGYGMRSIYADLRNIK